MLTQRWIWEFDVPRERLWTYLADTDWVNEHAGLPRIAVEFEPLPEGGTRKYGSFRQGPFLVRWEERPTIWQVPEFFTVERIYSHGPLRRFFNTTSFERLADDRTRVVVDLRLEAASPLIEPLLPMLAAHGKRGADRAFTSGASLARADGAPRAQASTSESVFTPLRDAGIDSRIVTTIAAFVEGAEDRDVQRMRPYELADRWRLPRREVLRAFLTATRVGLLNLRWSVLCPGCRGPSPGAQSLSDVAPDYHCPSCNLAFGPAFDRSVEVTFDARPLGRGGVEGVFCLASPQRSAHVHAQCAPAAGETTLLDLELRPGAYDVKAVGAGVAPFVVRDGEPSLELHAVVGADRVDTPEAVGSGRLQFSIANTLERGVIVRVEDGRWPDTVATAAQVTALQEFRDLFSSEVLAPGLELSVESIAVLFTDLVGSTAMYARTGDAPAFRIVKDHFDAVRSVIARHEGAVVKTIGDAVMAVFVDPANCLEAALELDGSVAQIECDGVPLRLRVGFHAGACIAMRANERIDYFGTTVNLAARLQSLSDAGQVTMARSDAQRPGIASRLAEIGGALATQTLTIKGFAQPIDVVRVSSR